MSGFSSAVANSEPDLLATGTIIYEINRQDHRDPALQNLVETVKVSTCEYLLIQIFSINEAEDGWPTSLEVGF